MLKRLKLQRSLQLNSAKSKVFIGAKVQPKGHLLDALKVSFNNSIKASLTSWYILGSIWLVLQHWTVRNTVVTTTTFQARPELLPAFFSSVPWL
ncbi:hypothetical protein Taro_041409 [Colocasia esculenta]|uniref:Uncharacterized protein n=1 Tax=Colocasia esculenta TaxID=4460 RepID=A0A843WTG8_COLES|nr:hypothetical protein [Colocasia esculenta]